MADDRKVFADSVTPLPPTDGPTHLGLMVARARPETGKERMTVVFSLALPDSAQADLQKMVAEGKVVAPKQLARNYSADAGDAKSLVTTADVGMYASKRAGRGRTSFAADSREAA